MSRAMNWEVEAPNVVTEARFRELVDSGYSAEILCQVSAHKKGPSYYGIWIMRAVSDDGVDKLLVTARTRTTHNDIKIREFKIREAKIREAKIREVKIREVKIREDKTREVRCACMLRHVLCTLSKARATDVKLSLYI